jgi:hypothetical protein
MATTRTPGLLRKGHNCRYDYSCLSCRAVYRKFGNDDPSHDRSDVPRICWACKAEMVSAGHTFPKADRITVPCKRCKQPRELGLQYFFSGEYANASGICAICSFELASTRDYGASKRPRAKADSDCAYNWRYCRHCEHGKHGTGACIEDVNWLPELDDDGRTWGGGEWENQATQQS